MKTASKQWRVILSVVVLLGAWGGPLAARAEEPEPPLDTYNANWPGSGTPNLEIGSFVTSLRYIEMADDFILPAGDTYGLVSNVNVEGNLPGGNIISSVIVRFYQNSGSLPGSLIYNATIVSNFPDGNLQLVLPTRAAIRTGQTYWVSVQAQIPNTIHNWYWETRNPQVGNPAAIRKSDDTACLNTWVPRESCESNAQMGPDLTFQLVYTPFTPTEFIHLPIISR